MLLATLYGDIASPYQHPSERGSVSWVLETMDYAYKQHGDTHHFLERVTALYANSIDYEWPQNRARVAFTDNWILYTLAYADPLMRYLDLTKSDNLFRAYETTDYRRAMERGFGICSQNAMGFASLLKLRYGIQADIIGLGGHVVVEAKGRILDASVGLALPYGLAEAEKLETENGGVSALYKAAFGLDVYREFDMKGDLIKQSLLSELGRYYDSFDNFRAAGVLEYRPKIYFLELASEWLKWIIPGGGVFLGLLGLYRSCYEKRQFGNGT